MIDCGDLQSPLNGSVILNGTVEGNSATYTCDEGFLPDGPVVRMCRNDKMWSGVPPMCEGESYVRGVYISS